MSPSEWQQWVERKRREYGDKFIVPSGCEHLIPYLHNRQRVEVESCGTIMRGFVGITTGWVPSFLLVRTKRSLGSSILLDQRTRIIRELNY